MSNLKIEGLIKDWCSICVNCIGKKRLDGHTYYICEDPYDGMRIECDAEKKVVCSKFEAKGDISMELKDYTECPLYKKMIKGCISSSDSDDIYFTSTQVYAMIQSVTEQKAIKYNHEINQLKIENKQLKDKIQELESDISRKDAQLSAMRLAHSKDDKRWNDLNYDFWIPLGEKLYGTTKLKKTMNQVLDDISEIKDRNDQLEAEYTKLTKQNDIRSKSNKGLMKTLHNLRVEVDQRKEAMDNQFNILQERDAEIERLKKIIDEIDISKVANLEVRIKNLKYLNEESYKREEELEKKLKKQECLNDMNAKTIADLVLEKKRLNDEIEKLRFTLGEKTEDLHKLSDNYDELLDKHSKLKCKLWDILQKKGELEETNNRYYNDNVRLENEAKKWKNKYKEAYDILETYFKYDFDGMEYDVSYGELSLTLRYRTPNGDNSNKYEALRSAYERLRENIKEVLENEN